MMEFRNRCRTDVNLSTISTFGIGGPASLYFKALTIADLQEAFRYIHTEHMPYLIVGRGSNCLFSDEGFPGLVIHNRIDTVANEGNGRFVVGGGYGFPALGVMTATEGWGGLEFAAGIPASVGGAVWMNAGCHGLQTASTVLSVLYVDAMGSLMEYRRDDLSFGYRLSSFQHLDGAIGSVTFQLQPDLLARQRQQEMLAHRHSTQPYKERSAGCAFRNPPGMSAGALIDGAGLKGTRIGGASVSPVHANFIVAHEGATARDVRSLIAVVKERVQAHCGILLECEIRMIGPAYE
jgi:UDP-N-acetylmuramate dehydrogenase